MSDQTRTRIQFNTETLLARSSLYQALALLYRHPWAHLHEISWQKEGEKWQEAAGLLDWPEKSALRDALSLLVKDLSQIKTQEWVGHYERYFGYTAHGPVPVYELEYGEEHSHRQPHQLGDIAAFYQAFGLNNNRNVHERVDHIAVECEFAHFLLMKEAYAAEHKMDEQADICQQAFCKFMEEHLGRWAPAFSLRLAKQSQWDFFKYLADFTSIFIIQDCQCNGVTPGPKDLVVRVPVEKEDPGCMTCGPGSSPCA